MSDYVEMFYANRHFFAKCLETLDQNSLLEEIHTHAINPLCHKVHVADGEVSTVQLLQVKAFLAGCEYILFE